MFDPDDFKPFMDTMMRRATTVAAVVNAAVDFEADPTSGKREELFAAVRAMNELADQTKGVI